MQYFYHYCLFSYYDFHKKLPNFLLFYSSLQTLRTLIARAFNIQLDTFLISYRFEDNLGCETFLELQTDDDLKIAFERYIVFVWLHLLFVFI